VKGQSSARKRKKSFGLARSPPTDLGMSAESERVVRDKVKRFNLKDSPNTKTGATNVFLPLHFFPFVNLPELRTLKATEVSFLECQGALALPIGEVMDVFAKNYFLYVHPCMPVIDEAYFWRHYRSVDKQGEGFSILLMRAVLFAAVSVSSPR
jgi:hypothetical protein